MLSVLNYYNGDMDGKYSDETKNAIIKFQKDAGYEKTGEIDNNTHKMLITKYEEITAKSVKASGKNELTINFPSEGYQTSETNLTFDAIYTGDEEVENIIVKVNNQKLKSAAEIDYNDKRTLANIDLKIPLTEGQNEIVTIVMTKTGKAYKKKVKVLFSKLKTLTGKNDSLIIYYSGHGILVPDPTAQDGKTAYLAPQDFETEYPEAKGIRLEEIKRLALLSPERIFLILDSCFSGSDDNNKNVKTASIKGFKMKAGGSMNLTGDFAKGEGRVLMASCLDNQVSVESETLKNSVFTYYLIKALNDGEKKMSEIFDSVYKNVKSETHGSQEPKLDTFDQKGMIYFY